MNAWIRSFWDEPAVAGPPRRVWRDPLLVALLAAACVVEVLVRPDVPLRWLSFAVALGGLPMLLVRRTRPLLAVCVVFGATLAMDVTWLLRGGDAPGLYAMGYVVVLGYALFRWGSGRDAMLGLVLMLVVASLSAAFDYSGLDDLIGGFALFFLVLATALAVRYRTRARAKALDEVRAREREGLARDLHDTVAHHVSAIAIRAQAGLAVAAGDPAGAVEALRVIDAEASRALAEMRTIVRGLRGGDPAELTPLPTIGDIRAFPGAAPGPPEVNVRIEGDEAVVPGPVSAAVYRVAQEAVTNARRHARRASRIDVVVRAGGDAVTVEVVDDGEAPAARRGEGFGIAGMVERAERLGGSCTAGPRGGRGWRVLAELPLGGVAS